MRGFRKHRQALAAVLSAAMGLGGVPAATIAPGPSTVQAAPTTSQRPLTTSTAPTNQVQTDRLSKYLGSHRVNPSGCPWPGRSAAWSRRTGRGGDWR